MHDLLAFPDSARVWIYQADKAMPENEVTEANQLILQFAERWTSHNAALKATGGLLHDRFIVLVVNEDLAGVSGCSIDSSVKFVKAMGEKYGLDFMNRQLLTYLDGDDQVRDVHMHHLPPLYATGEVGDDTLFFNNLVETKADFLTGWLVPLKEGWMKRFL